jgi:hypothetical protein
VNVVDTTAPVITLNGANPLTVECHSSFTDPGATANDACAGPVAVTNSGSVNVNVPGSYTITYTASDGTNTATATRTVNVVDTTAPVITLNGANPLTVECHGSFTDPGATATDTCAGSLPVTVSGSIDVNTVGTYTLTYTATDPSGNTVTATRTVNVVDTTPPAITVCAAVQSASANASCQATVPDFTGDVTATDNCSGVTVTQTPAAGTLVGLGTHTISLKVTDAAGNSSTCTTTFNVVSLPPSANAGGPYSVNEGGSVVVMASGSDPEGGTVTFAWDLDNSGTFETSGPSATFSAVGLDGPSSRTITVRATDNCGSSTTAQATVNVLNVAPTVGAITAPIDPIEVGTNISANASFTDPGVLDTHTAVWDWGDGSTSAGTVTKTNGSGSVSGSHPYAAPGVYTVKLTVTDDDGGSGQITFQFIVVFDTGAGFVTGGGWIDSPTGAYSANPSLTGKANFGFVAKYQQGSTTPTGETEFNFQKGNLNFHSTGYDWLVIVGAKAQFKGSGRINGSGDYAFLVTVNDGQATGGGGVDKFRIKIWNKSTGQVVYDNQMGDAEDADATQAIAGGSIVIHQPK